jgi:hypothetical protein
MLAAKYINVYEQWQQQQQVNLESLAVLIPLQRNAHTEVTFILEIFIDNECF